MIQKGGSLKRLSVIGIVTILFGLTALPAMAYSNYRSEEVYAFGNREGYSMGYRRGIEDYRNHRKFDYKSDGAYKNGEYGYRKEFGHKGEYKNGFKNGFQRGYDDAFYSRGYHEPHARYEDRYGRRY